MVIVQESRSKKYKKGDKHKDKGKGKKGKEKAKKEEEIEEEEEEEEEEYLPRHESDEWSWYSISCSEEEEQAEEQVVEEEEKKKDKKDKKGKKGKGGKKGKKAKKDEGEEKPKEEVEEKPKKGDDVVAQVIKIKEESGESPPKEKKGKKEKKEKKEKLPDNLTPGQLAKLREQMKKQQEEEEKRRREEEKRRQEEEKRQAILKEKRETVEQQLRMEQLALELALVDKIAHRVLKLMLKDKAALSWEKYIKCDGLPFVTRVAQMHTYLTLWERQLPTMTIDDVAAKVKEVLQIMYELEDNIDEPLNTPPQKVKDWIWVRNEFRETLMATLDHACCRALSNMKVLMRYKDVTTTYFNRKEDDFTISIFALVKLPTPMPNPRRPPKPRLSLNFEPMNMTVLFPDKLTCYCLALRGMYLKFDHKTDQCHTYLPPKLPDIMAIDLRQATFSEWNQKLYYKYVNRYIPEQSPQTEQGDQTEVEEEEPEVDVERGIIPIVPCQILQPTASQYYISMEDDYYQEAVESMKINLSPDEINLRRYAIIGGIYYFNLFYQLTQPKQLLSMDVLITNIEFPQCLRSAPFYEKYVPPPSPGPGVTRTPEEMEDEMKQQEELLDKLILISLKLPTHVFWLDEPIVCQWDKENLCWSTKDVHDVKYTEDQGSIQFRTGRFGSFAMAVNRFCNLPYQTWEIKPLQDGTISFQITAAIVMIEFNIRGKEICLADLKHCPKLLNHEIGQYYRLPRLIWMLRTHGIDVFPDHDAFCYGQGVSQKHWPMERNLYYNMAQLSSCHNFVWSRWNAEAGRRQAVMQIREYDPSRDSQPIYFTLLVTPIQATYINCTEVSSNFSNEPLEGIKFCSDLYYLMRATSRMVVRAKVQSNPLEVVGAFADLLMATKILSFS